MSSKEHVHNLMAEIGPLLELMQITESAEGNSWLLVVDEETAIDLDYNEMRNRVILAGEVGLPADENRYGFYETILQYNYLWEETDGLKMALDGPAGNVWIMFDTTASDLDISMLQTVIVNFCETLRSWREAMKEEKL